MFKTNRFRKRLLALILSLSTICTTIPLTTFFDVKEVKAQENDEFPDEFFIGIEQQVIEAYKTKADEKNVVYMRDRDSIIGDVVENIVIEGSTGTDEEQCKKKGVGYWNSYTSEFKEVKNDFRKYWALSLMAYSIDTGWSNGTWTKVHNNWEKGEGYVFDQDASTMEKQLKNASKMRNDQKQEIVDIINKSDFASKLESKYKSPKGKVVGVYEKDWKKNGATYRVKFHIEYYDMDGNKVGTSNSIVLDATSLIQAMNKCFNGAYRSNLAYSDEYVRTKIIQTYVNNNPIDSNTSNVFTTQYMTSSLYDKKAKVYNLKKSGEDTCTGDIYFSLSNSAKRRNPQKNNTENTVTLSKLENGQAPSNVKEIAYFVACQTTIPNLNKKNVPRNTKSLAYKLRKECLEKVLLKQYNTYYVNDFTDTVKKCSLIYTNKLYNHNYVTSTKYRSYFGKDYGVMYEGAYFSLAGLGSSYHNLGTSTFYWPANTPVLNNFNPNSTNFTEKLDYFLQINNPLGVNHPLTEVDNFINRSKNLKSYVDEHWQNPVKLEIVFNDSTIQYAGYLTTSCILDSPLDRYEFWAQNFSNKDDTTYYGEAKLVETNKTGTTSNVKLSPIKNWGVYMFTRYKYCNYVYKIFYGFYGDSPQMTIVKKNNNQPNAISGGVGTPIAMTKSNYYGWFWKYTYSKREKSGGYYLDTNTINQVQTAIENRLMQTLEPGNGIYWMNTTEIKDALMANHNYDYYTSMGGSLNNKGITSGKGDIYRYKQAVRCETIYYQVIANYMVDKNGGTNPPDYTVKLGNGTFNCADNLTLCDCEEDGSCMLDKNDMILSSTLTN